MTSNGNGSKERDSLASTETAQPRQAPLPESIGPYKILELIGEGGMGIVYLAEQSKPLRRRVALKVIKPGMGRPYSQPKQSPLAAYVLPQVSIPPIRGQHLPPT